MRHDEPRKIQSLSAAKNATAHAPGSIVQGRQFRPRNTLASTTPPNFPDRSASGGGATAAAPGTSSTSSRERASAGSRVSLGDGVGDSLELCFDARGSPPLVATADTGEQDRCVPPFKMVNERLPPKAPLGLAKQNEQPFILNEEPIVKPTVPNTAPRFGYPTMAQSHLSRTALESKVLIMPKPAAQDFQKNQPRMDSAQSLDGKPAPQTQPQNRPPFGAPIPISRPSDGLTYITTKPAPPPAFGSMGSTFRPVNQQAGPRNFVDLTLESSRDRFAAPEPYSFVDPSKAAEDIKALLEGAIEDEDDISRTRLRKRKSVKTEGLAAKLKGLSVTGDTESTPPDQDSDDEDDGTVEGVDVKLLPHQVEGVEWMRERELGTGKKGTIPKGGILADDMGLGKTIQSISLILTNPKPSDSDLEDGKRKYPKEMVKSTLVVAPLALIRQWELELKEKIADSHRLHVCVHHGPNRTKRYEDLKKYDVVITTYQILVSEYAGSSNESHGIMVGCFGLHWYRVILDEAHTIKNRNAKATQACYGLRSVYRWCLTGTPMQNNLDELQSLIKFLRIKPYDDLATWKDQIDRPMKNGRGSIAIKRLQHYLKTFMKRRTKEILKQDGALNPGGKPSIAGAPSATGFKVTERRIEKVFAQFSAGERHFYDRLEQRTDKSLEEMMDANKVNYASALVLLLRLRQACNHPKLVAGKLGKDSEALGTESGNGSQNSRKAKVLDEEMEEIADMFGGLGVDAKKCDVCGSRLSQDLSQSGAIRCDDCENDLELVGKHKSAKGKGRKKSHAEQDEKDQKQPMRKPRNRPVIPDSDDEDEGEWIGAGEDPGPVGLGKAGGTDDENAEGEGESIGSSDTESEAGGDSAHGSDDEVEFLGSKTKGPKEGNKTGEVIDSDGSGSESDVEDEFQSSSEDEAKLATAISSTKIAHLLEILGKEAKQHKFIVFSQFTSMLDIIEPFLKRDGYRYTRYDGSMKNDAREASLSRLRTDKSCRVLLCSLKCGSLGLNLTAASRVVILEPFWNPFVEEQAIDRVHRLTQKIDVVVYKITIKDTVEERILDLQEKKRELANQAIAGGPKAKAQKLGTREILQLFRREAEHIEPESSDYSMSIKPRILSRGSASATSSREGSVIITGERRTASPPVSQSGGKADEIYGRRW